MHIAVHSRRWFDEWKRYTGCELGQLGDKQRIKLRARSPTSSASRTLCTLYTASPLPACIVP